MKHWIISDTHFGHTNIINYCKRPFQNSQEMDQVIIDNINSCVKKNDILWHLGDFLYGRYPVTHETQYQKYLSQINCKNIILILGNHDKIVKKYKIIRKMFLMVNSYWCGYIYGIPFIMNHRSIKQEKHNSQALNRFIYHKKDIIILHGHTHNKNKFKTLYKNHYVFNISVEQTDYKPILLSSLID